MHSSTLFSACTVLFAVLSSAAPSNYAAGGSNNLLAKRDARRAQLVEARDVSDNNTLLKRDAQADRNARYVEHLHCGKGSKASDNICSSYASQFKPAYSQPKCDRTTGKCFFACNNGYNYYNNVCVPSRDQCRSPNGNTFNCPAAPANGFYTCGTNQCYLKCGEGYRAKRYAPNKGTQCVAFESDAQNCGRENNVCGASYNGVGSPVCDSGKCSLDCPSNAPFLLRTRQQRLAYCSTTPAPRF